MNLFYILIFAIVCTNIARAHDESTTSSSITSTLSKPNASTKIKRQYQLPFARPPNYSPYVGDAATYNARRYADAQAQTINQVDQKDSNGNYNYAYETTNGIKVRQTSYMVGNNRVVVGYYSYIGPDGKLYTTQYTADQNGYRATGSHLPVQDGVQPVPLGFSDPNRGPFIPNSPVPFPQSTPLPFGPPVPFGSPPPLNNVPSSTSIRPFQVYSSTGATSTAFAPTISPPVVSSRRPPFPLYNPPNQGYIYDNPRINSPYSVVSQQTSAPLPFPSSSPVPFSSSASSNFNSRFTTPTPLPLLNDINAFSSTTISPLAGSAPVSFKPYIPPPPITPSTPRPFNDFSPNQPNSVLITPKPAYQRLPNSLSISQNLLPPYLSVGPLISSPGPQNTLPGNPNFLNNPGQIPPQSVAPLTITNLNFRKKRGDEN